MLFVNIFLLCLYFRIVVTIRQFTLADEIISLEGGILSSDRTFLHKRFGNELQERVLWEAYKKAFGGGNSSYDAYVHLDQLLGSSAGEDSNMASDRKDSDYDSYAYLDELLDISSDEYSDMASVREDSSYDSYAHFDQLLHTSTDDDADIASVGEVSYQETYDNFDQLLDISSNRYSDMPSVEEDSSYDGLVQTLDTSNDEDFAYNIDGNLGDDENKTITGYGDRPMEEYINQQEVYDNKLSMITELSLENSNELDNISSTGQNQVSSMMPEISSEDSNELVSISNTEQDQVSFSNWTLIIVISISAPLLSCLTFVSLYLLCGKHGVSDRFKKQLYPSLWKTKEEPCNV